MAQSLNVKLKGLHTFQSDLSEVPEGALAQADNIIIDRDSIAEPRRGFDVLKHSTTVQSTFSDASYRANRLFYYQSKILVHYDTNLLAYHDDTTGWINYSGTYAVPNSTTKVRSAAENQNLYFTTSLGVYKLDAYTGTPSKIGVPPGLDTNLAVSTSQVVSTVTVSGSKVITPAAVTGLAIGMQVSGTGIAASSIIVSIQTTTVTLNNNATSSATNNITYAAPTTWLLAAHTTSYRIVWGIKDANNNLVIGAPSQRVDITNTTGATAAVNVNFSVPSGITTAHFYQIYRPNATDSTNGNVEPSDEMGLVYEGNPLAGDITIGSITVCDIVPDALRGATIYTAQSQEGIGNANEPPPFALDLAVFKNCLFYGNTKGLQNYNLTLLGVGSPAGVQSGDTLTLDGVAFTAGSSETVSSGTFQVFSVYLNVTSGTTNSSTSLTSVSNVTGIAAGQLITGTGIPAGTYVVSIASTTVTMSQAATASATVTVTFTGDSAAQAIRDTALSLVKVINRYASSTLYAYYLSGPADLPGQILLTARTVGTSSFPVISSRGTCWNPALPTSGTTQSSINDAFKNGLFYSKTSQPEAVPLGNFSYVGSADKAILRIIALRDSLFILKEDGIFRLYGTDPSNFQISPLDYTAVLIAPDSAVALNNQIFALTSQGVVAISDTGVQIVSRAIESDLTSLNSQNLSVLQTTSFGVAYETQRTYYLWVISNGADTAPTQYYRYNYVTQCWTRGTLAKGCGGVNPADDRLYLGNSSSNFVDIERKSLTYADYADYQSTLTISNVTGTAVTLSSGSDTVLVGSILYQSASVFGTVAAVNSVTGIVTTTLSTSLVAGSVDVLSPIPCAMAWVPVTLANPGMTKQIREAALLFLSDFNGTGTVGFSTDVSPGSETETITGGAVGGWGLFAWGGPLDTPLGAPWGGNNRRRPIRVMVPRNHQRSSVLAVSFDHSYGYSPWLLQGISLIGDLTSERTGT